MAGGTSCSDDYAVPDYSRPASNTIAFSCQSAWGEDNRTLWTEESRIGLFCGQTNSSNVALGAAAISVGEPLGLFYTKLPWAAGEHTFYLYMPYDEANASTRLTGSLGATQFQNGVSAAHVAQSSLAYAAVTSVETENPVAVTLRHVFGYLDLAVTTAKWQGWSVESVVVTSKSGTTLAGDYTFDMPTAKLAFTGNESPSVTLKVSGATLGEGRSTAMPPWPLPSVPGPMKSPCRWRRTANRASFSRVKPRSPKALRPKRSPQWRLPSTRSTKRSPRTIRSI